MLALSACLGYYLASVAGLQLRLPPATTSVVWPPNAVLTSILVLSPPRRWWVILLAALPAHIYLELGTGWSLPFVLSLFVTNSLEALLAAGGMHLLSDAPSRFDTLRRLSAFVVAAIAAAALSSFADAAVVTWFNGEPYWHVFRTRLLSNVLAALTVVPAIVGGVQELVQWWSRRRVTSRMAEWLILCLSLSAIVWVDFSRSFTPIAALRAVSSQTPLAVQLPVLLWAAMRFGPAGTGLTLLTTSLINAWAVVHGHGPFASIPAATTITALTLSQIFVTTTLLFLATLLEERHVTQHELRRRLRFEGLLSRFSAALVERPSDQMHRAFETWLGPISAVLGIDALTLFADGDGLGELRPVYSWAAASQADPPNDKHLEWARGSLAAEKSLAIPVGADDRDLAGGAVPLIGQAHVLGALAFGPVRSPQPSDDLKRNMRLVAEVLASALERKRSEDALRASELMKSDILESLSSGVAVVDHGGTLLQTNDSWTLGVEEFQWKNVRVDTNLVDTCRTVAERGDRFAGAVADGVAGVLSGSRARFSLEHSTDNGSGTEWWSVSAVPLNRAGGGAVITHSNITELRRAELEAQRSRQELAHVSRVSTVGEMTASLAHELNQPLTAILTNAQTAQRLLDSVPAAAGSMSGVAVPRGGGPVDHDAPELSELRAILTDIISDDRRASDVIVRLRKLLRKGEPEMTWFNLTAAIQEVVELVSRDAITRNVVISVAPAGTPVMLRGDRVQLQQVILNLLQNAMDAMSDQRDRPRTVHIACQLDVNDRRARVSVQDSGPGIASGSEDTIFEPFYTTKTGGMGMGLSIARSIVEAHGGSIRVNRGSVDGAHVELLLPLDGAGPA